MKTTNRILPLLVLLLGLKPASAGVLTYSLKAAFLGDLQPGFYYTNFSGIPVNFDVPYMTLEFTNAAAAIGYTVSSASGLFRTPSPDVGLGNWTASADILVTFNTPNVRTIGADFFLLNFNGDRLNGDITVTFSDGTTATVPSTTSGAYGFFGISSDDPLSSMTISGSTGGDIYEQLANFYVSSSASVPATTVIVEATAPNASQSGPTPGVFTITRTNVNSDYSAPLAVKFALAGTATNGVYTCTPAGVAAAATNIVTLAAGQTSTNISIVPVVDGLPRPTTTVDLTLLRNSGYAPNAPSTATVLIQNISPQLLLVSPSIPSMYKRHLNDFAEVTLTRWGNTNAAAYSVSSFTYGGSATLGTDFTAATPVTFNPGELTKTARVSPLNSNPGVYAGNKTILLGLSASGGYGAGGAAVPLTIIDSANPPAPVLYTNALTSAADASNWNITGANANSDVVPPDGEASFGYDLVADPAGAGVITNPPGGAPFAMRVTVNKINATAGGVNLYLTNQSLSGDFAVRFNMNIVEDTAAGTTQGPIIGINHNGLETNWWSGSAVLSGGPWASDGLWFWLSADGGALVGDYLSSTGQGGALPNTNRQDILPPRKASEFASVFKKPAPYTGYGSSGLVANDPPALGGDTRTWTDVEIKQFRNVVTLSLNKIPIFTFTNTTTFKSGYLMLGYVDPYNSIGQPAGAVYYANLSVVRLTPPLITQITRAGSNVTLEFTSTDGTDTPASFKLQTSSNVSGTYADDGSATITQLPNGTFSATTTSAYAAQFYRIRKL